LILAWLVVKAEKLLSVHLRPLLGVRLRKTVAAQLP
jgi:hypothetical protein